MRLKGVLAALCAWALAACGAGGDGHGEGRAQARGDTSELPTIVSLNPCLDAILVDIAEPQQILALSHYSRDQASSSLRPDVAARFPITGGTAEEIIALQPDLVLASTFIAPSSKAALEQLGVRVETFGSPAALEESLTQIERLAALAGREAQGKGLTARINNARPRFAGSAAGTDQVSALLWQPGQIVAGEESLVREHLERFGFANHAAAMGLGQADHVTLEAILADPPDLLLVAGQSAGQQHPLLASLDTTRIAPFEPSLFYCGGPSIPLAWERLEEIRLSLALNPPGEGAAHHHAH